MFKTSITSYICVYFIGIFRSFKGQSISKHILILSVLYIRTVYVTHTHIHTPVTKTNPRWRCDPYPPRRQWSSSRNSELSSRSY